MVETTLKETQLVKQWQQQEEETLDDKLLDILSHDEFKQPKTIYQEYQEKHEDCKTRHTVTRHLIELEKIGKVESKGRSASRKYRNASKPLQETREDFTSAFSEGIPPFMKKRVRVEAERAVQEEVDRIQDKVRDEVIKKMNGATNPRNQGNQLDSHSKALLNALPCDKAIQISGLKEMYSEEVENPLSKRSIRRRLKGLAAKDKVEIKGRGSARTYTKKRRKVS